MDTQDVYATRLAQGAPEELMGPYAPAVIELHQHAALTPEDAETLL